MPVDVDVALGKSGELLEGAAREIETVDATAGAKVAHGDSDGAASICKLLSAFFSVAATSPEDARVATSCLPPAKSVRVATGRGFQV